MGPVYRYSSTEAGMITWLRIVRSTPIEDVMPAGYPANDREILILDDAGQPLPVGEVGEIAVRSRFLSPGYWRQPQITAAQFQSSSTQTGEALYRTGDFGRLRQDGQLDFLGRQDAQVKVRGFRVHLAVTESALLSVPGVREAVVLARPDRFGDARIVAYVVLSDATLTADSLRVELLRTLPDYFVPSRFVMVDALPRTANGKIDRLALPDPDAARPTLAADFVPPRTETERALARIWSNVLGMGEIGVHDPFIELGGNSLLAVRVVTLMRYRFGVHMPVRALFDTPTIAELAQRIEASSHPYASRLREMVEEVEQLSDEDVERLLDEARRASDG